MMDFRGLLTAALQQLVPFLSPKLREIVVDVYEKARDAAKETSNKFDDLLVSILKDVLDIDSDELTDEMEEVGKEVNA